MGLSKTEINLKRLLASAPQQQNHAKLIHYVATLREQLEQLATERNSEGLPRVSKATVNEYSDKIEAIAAKLANPVSNTVEPRGLRIDTKVKEDITKKDEESISPGLRRRLVHLSAEHRDRNTFESTDSSPVKSPVQLDAAAQAHIMKHRKLQEELTDEMVGLAQKLKESSLMMNKPIKSTEKILGLTEKAVEHSLASTGRVNTQAMAMQSDGFKTSCFTWLVMFVMTCIFVMVVLLIRVT